MPSARNSRVAVGAHRYGIQRLEHALATGESLRGGLHGPRPGMWTAMSVALAGVAVAGSAVYGVLKPQPSLGKASVAVDTQEGVAYVISNHVAHPAMNLASAVLASAGSGGNQTPSIARVNSGAINRMSRGQLIGIPGAPNTLPDTSHQLTNEWSACDDTTITQGAATHTRPSPSTNLYLGVPVSLNGPTVDGNHGVLVTADNQNYYLVTGGRRILVANGGNGGASSFDVLDIFAADRSSARLISPGVLNAIPERGTITAKPLTGANSPVHIGSVSAHVGDVLDVQGSSAMTYFLVTQKGIQPISHVQADLLNSAAGKKSGVSASEGDISSMKQTDDDIGMAGLPDTWPSLIPTSNTTALCVSWNGTGSTPTTSVELGSSLPATKNGSLVPAPPSSAPASATSARNVFMPAGWGMVLGVSPSERTPSSGAAHLITDQGLDYPIADSAALAALGYKNVVKPGSQNLLALLPKGPTLSITAAQKLYTQSPDATPSGK